jgi:putative ABC transport system permease protein
MDLRIALRNVFRNRRRTLFSLTVIVVGTVIFIVLLGFIGEALHSTQQSLACETGAVQVADARLFENRTTGYDALIAPDVRDHVLDIIATMPGVIGSTAQLNFAGLIGDQEGSTLVLGRGIIPCNCVQNYSCIVTTGDDLPDDASRDVILGRALAKKLGVGVGDRISIATSTVNGNFNAATVSVIGELTYSVATVEKQLGLFPIAFVQRLLKTDGVERILIGLDDLSTAHAFAADLQTRLDADGIVLSTRTWDELNPTYESLQTFYTAFSGLAGIAVFMLVFFSVIEVLTISFLERTREVGTVRAFGATRSRVFRTFLAEGILIGLIGGALGAAIGIAVAFLFNSVGFTWTPPGAAIPQAIRLQLSIFNTLVPFVTVIVATLTSSIYPALKNARLRIVEALQSV